MVSPISNHPRFAVAAVYLARKAEGITALQAFASSYAEHPAGIDHDLVIIYKGYDGNSDLTEAQKVFAPFKHVGVELPDEGYDLGSFLTTADRLPHEYICCLNTFSRILADDWLKKFHTHASQPDVGIVGATGSYEGLRDTIILVQKGIWIGQQLAPNEALTPLAQLRDQLHRYFAYHMSSPSAFAAGQKKTANSDASAPATLFPGQKFLVEQRLKTLEISYQKWWESVLVDKQSSVPELLRFPSFPNPHIRTNAFMMKRERFLAIGKAPIVAKMDACRFESGPAHMTGQIMADGLKARIVGKNGAGYDVADWPTSNTFRLGDQANLLVADNQTALFKTFSDETRALFALLSWGENNVSLPKDFPDLNIKFYATRSTIQAFLQHQPAASPAKPTAEALVSPLQEALLSRTLSFCDECLGREDFSGAWKALCRAVTLAPDNTDVLNHRGRLALFLKDMDNAHHDFAEALKINPRCAAAFSGLSRWHLQKGQATEAAAAADKALGINPTDEEAVQLREEISCITSNNQLQTSSKKDLPNEPQVGLSTARPTLSLALLQRIKTAYRIAISQSQAMIDPLWTAIADRKLPIHQALMGEDVESLKNLLTDPSRCELFYGFESHFEGCVANQRKFTLEGKNAAIAKLMLWLKRLGEALGVRRRESAEHRDFVTHPRDLTDVEALLNEMDKVCGTRLTFPNPFPDDFGLLTSRGFCSYRALNAIYQAWKLRELSQIYGGKILEIGAGLGRTAYYARAFGLTEYTIVELPMTSVAPAIFLGQVVGSEAVSLLGENATAGQIRIVTPEWLARTDESFDLILNADSLPEIGRYYANRYAEFAGSRAKAVLSINHEAGAFKTIEVLGGTMQLAQRSPYWMREGYCEELFTQKSIAAIRAERDAARVERDAARAERVTTRSELTAARQSIYGPFSTEISNDALSLDARSPNVTDRNDRPIWQPPELMFPPHYFRPLNVSINPALADKQRLNILLPSTSAAHNSGGPNTAYLLAAQLAQAGVPLRIVAVNMPADADSTAIRAHIVRLSGVSTEVINNIELVDGSNRNSPLVLGENDVFFATAWWTAQMIKYLLPRFRQKRFIYLIQDYEPNLHPISTNSLLALETYSLDYFPVVNSRLLFDHFVTEKVGRFSDNEFVRSGCWFEPSVDRNLYFAQNGMRRPNGKRRLMFYARPDAPRNLLELGIAALMRLLDEGTWKAEDWEFFSTQTGIGGSCRPVRLSLDGTATLVPLALQELSTWASEMRRTDVLLSLIWSPHTSYPVLEGAASGAVVVTNTCGVKNSERLHQLSPNIIAGVPTIEGIAEALVAAAARTGDWPALSAGAQMGLPINWEQSFADCLPRLLDFLQQAGVAPAKAEAAYSY